MTRSWARLHRPLRVLAVVLALALVLAATGCEEHKQRSVKGASTDFTLKDTAGNAVSLSDYRGKVVMLEFWATWCPPCRASVPELKALHERFQGRDFALVGVSMDESKSAVKDFIEEQEIPYTVLMEDGGVSDQYGVFSIPTSFIIGKDGVVESKHMGYGDGMIESLSQEIEELLKRPAPAPQQATAPHEETQGETTQQ